MDNFEMPPGLEEHHPGAERDHILKKLVSISLSILIAAFILSLSIACPLLCRPVYYLQVKSLHLSEQTGYSEKAILEAYDDIMDYCTGGGERTGRTFHTGMLAWSEEGKDHFDDVERLFHLDFMIAVISGIMLAAYLISRLIAHLRNRPGLKPYRFLGRGPLFWGPAFLTGTIGIMAFAAIVDFDGFFTWFHHLLFSGKENWLLDVDTDEIILILPYDVLQTFGAIIIGLILVFCVICMIIDFRHYGRT